MKERGAVVNVIILRTKMSKIIQVGRKRLVPDFTQHNLGWHPYSSLHIYVMYITCIPSS